MHRDFNKSTFNQKYLQNEGFEKYLTNFDFVNISTVIYANSLKSSRLN